MNPDRTADNSDLATQQEQVFLAAAMSHRKPEGPIACGHCLNCEEPLPRGARWCDADCRTDWEKREAQS
jgi:hypothetical protein